jgi:pimeloyl-ACP methyl ester carboxylesterase
VVKSTLFGAKGYELSKLYLALGGSLLMVVLGMSAGTACSQTKPQTEADTQMSLHLPLTKRQCNDWRKEIKKALFIPDPLPALATTEYGTFSPASGVIAERLTYGTLYGMRVPAIVYRPATPRKHMPGMVIVNGHQGDKTSWYAFYSGILYARAGAVVVTYDPIGEDERNSSRKSETSSHDTVVPGAQMPARMGGQMITDILEAVSYLRSRKDVYPKRIAVAAYSMGSFHAAIAGAIDPRIHALVLSGGGNLSGPGDYWAISSKVMCQSGPSKALDFLPDRGAVLYALNQRRGPTFIMNGTRDKVMTSVNTDEVFFTRLKEQTAAISGTDAGLFETYWFPGAGHRPNFVTRPAALWLQRQLHFPNWTGASIEAAGEIEVSEWAAQSGAHVGQTFLNELSEGGVQALTTDIPNVPREDLQTVPAAEWKLHKDDYVWEGWVKRASQASQ